MHVSPLWIENISHTHKGKFQFVPKIDQLDCKTVRIFAYSIKYARAVKQKVWNEAENRERDWGETLKIRTVVLQFSVPKRRN